MKIKVGFIELGKGDFQVAVPVVSWQEMAEVKRGVVEYLTVLGEEIETTELIEFEGFHWFIVWLKLRPGLLKAIEISVLAVIRRLRKRKAFEVLITKTYHPQMKTFLIPTQSREDGLRLREALVEYIEDQLKGGIRVSEVDCQGTIEVICPIDKIVKVIRPLERCLGSRKSLLKAGTLK